MANDYSNSTDYPESDLTQILIGLAFEMWNRLGFGYQEKYYERAYAQLLVKRSLSFKEQQKAVIAFMGRKIGRYFIDFVVANRVVVELKVGNDFYLQHNKQVLGYLKATGLQVGLLILITKQGIKVKRFANTKSAKSA